jgi:hypothetical protein
MGHASITVTAHIYADLYDDELDEWDARESLMTAASGTLRGRQIQIVPL